jgi:hypothetical protein
VKLKIKVKDLEEIGACQSGIVMLDKIIKYFLIAVVFIGLGYAWRMIHEPGFIEQAKLYAMGEIYNATERGIPFQFCLDDSDKCMRFIPRADDRMKYNVKLIAGKEK